MLAARRIPRCNTCSVTLLNSLFSACGANVRLPIPARAAAATRARHSGLLGAARGLHSSFVRPAPPPPVDEIFDEVVESVTETITEVFETEETGEVVGAVTESVVNNITIERRTVRKEKEDEEHETAVTEEEEYDTAATEEAVVVVGEEADSEVKAAPAASSEQAIPWFLRVETPRPASHPFADRQALPALPPAPPKALEPLLEHISSELGIGDLAIMDLRTMDPPPAIGPDTIMVIGNARSERHLHTSADKLCRWLRSEWKMRPDADGLLGRGELKIKNRRLKKRGKLVNTQTGQEEGVGWICINAGDQGLVVQLFTQHRREEIDLEGLWGKYLGKDAITRSPKATSADELYNEDKKKKELEEEEEEDIDDNAEVQYNPRVPLIRLGAGLSTGSDYASTRPQRRLFHTSPPRRILETLVPTDPANPRSTYLIDDIPFKGIEVPRSVKQGKPWHLTKRLPPTYTPETHSTISELVLRAHINQLKTQYPGYKANGSRTGPCTLLGSGPADKDSTPFLQSFHAHLPRTTTPKAQQLHLELLIEANRISPQHYPSSCLLSFLDTIAKHTPPPTELYYLVLRALSDSPSFRATTTLPHEEAATARLAALDAVTAHMLAQHPGASTTSPEFQLCRLRALAPAALPLIHTLALTVCDPALETPTHVLAKRATKHRALGSYRLDARVHELDAAVRAAGHAHTLREYQEMLLVAYAMAGAWRAFWNVWARMRYLGVRRDGRFYELVVGLVVMGGVQREAVLAGRALVAGMGREVPAVIVDVGLAKGLLALVEVAEGPVAESAEGGAEKGEWRMLREKCERVIKRGVVARSN